MRNRSTIPVALAGALLLGSLPLAPAVAQKGPGDPEPPIILRLLVGDDRGRQSEPAAEDLARLADELTDGAITIVPAFAGGDVATAVMNGETDLGMLPSRDWDAVGVTSLDVLEAPFLIDNDALALAVATGDIAGRAMSGLDAVGVTGLTMWPEDLRHLFALDRSGADLSTPEGLSGADILVVAGQPGHDLITQLGGRVYAEGVPSGDLTGDRGVDSGSGALEGMVTGLWGAGLPTQDVTVAGDLVIYSKYQMLVANTAKLDALTERQRELLDQVMAAAHAAALARHFTEADLAAERCQKGGTVMSIGPDAVQAFRTAAQPLTDRLAADPVTGELMAAIESLKQQTPAAPGAGTCEPPGANASPSAVPLGSPSSLLVDGVYRAELTREGLVAAGSPDEDAAALAGVITWTIDDGRFSQEFVNAQPGTCTGTLEALEESILVDWTENLGCWGSVEVRVTPIDTGLRMTFAGCGRGIASECDPAVDRALWTRDWIRVGDVTHAPDAPSSPAAAAGYPVSDTAGYSGTLPPDGVYRADVTYDDLVAGGSSPSWAGLNAHMTYWTFEAGTEVFSFEQPESDCRGTLTSVDGRVVRQLSDCGDSFDFMWKPETDGSISAILIGPPPGHEWTQQDFLDFRPLIERNWTRIADAPTASLPATGFIGDRLPPDGTYRAEMTEDDLVAQGASPAYAAQSAGVWTMTTTGDRWTMTYDRTAAHCSGTASIVGDVNRWTDDIGEDMGCTGAGDWRWRTEGDGIRAQFVPSGTETPEDVANYRAFNDRVWTRIGDAPSATSVP